MKALAKISWDPDRRIAQVWKHDRRGWFRAGWGFDVKGVAAGVRATGFRAEIVDHAKMGLTQ
jgi:hypothetical protein